VVPPGIHLKRESSSFAIRRPRSLTLFGPDAWESECRRPPIMMLWHAWWAPQRKKDVSYCVPLTLLRCIPQFSLLICVIAGHCDEEFAMKISVHSERNLRRALLMLEAAKVQSQSNSLSKDMEVQLPDWFVE
jgi:hypothetical protein